MVLNSDMIFPLKQYGSQLAVVTEDGQELSYLLLGNLIDTVNEVISEEKGLTFCLCQNSLGSLVGYLAMLQSKIPAVMLDGDKNSAVVRSLIDVYKPTFLWLPKDRNKEFGGDEIFCYESYSLVKFIEHAPYEIHPDVALLLTTSGSTGSPKLVKLTEKNLLSNAESIAQYLDITNEERPVTSLPMHYSFGLSVINSHLLKGATLLLTGKPVIQKEFWEFVKEQSATSLSGVPYTYEMLKRLKIFQMDLPALRTMTQAGGKLNAKIAQEYIEGAKATGKRFIIMYGQTEATARMSYLPEDMAREKYASIGIAIPGGKFSLIDTDGNEIITADVDGELIYEGANVSMGYAESIADLAKGDENNGVLHTGDVARRDNDGYYYITGRLKRFVKVWGNRCNLDAIEQIVKTEVTTNCACSGCDDKVVVFVTENGNEGRIKSLLCETTGLNVRAFTVKQIDVIPKNTSGKVLYAELQKMI